MLSKTSVVLLSLAVPVLQAVAFVPSSHLPCRCAYRQNSNTDTGASTCVLRQVIASPIPPVLPIFTSPSSHERRPFLQKISTGKGALKAHTEGLSGTFLDNIDKSGGSPNLLLSYNGDGDGSIVSSLSTILFAGLAIAASIFLYANVVYTPEIMQNAEAMRAEERATQLLGLVKQLQNEDGRDISMEDSKKALEAVFGMTVGEYMQSIDEKQNEREEAGGIGVSDAEKELVEVLRSIYG